MEPIPNAVMLGQSFCPDIRLYYFCRHQPPYHTVTRVRRNHHFIFFILKGKGTFETPEGVFPLEAGDIFCLYPSEQIVWQPDPEDPWDRFCVELIGRDVPTTLNRLGFTPTEPVFRPREPQKTATKAEQIWQTMYAEKERPLLLQEQLFYLLHYLEDLRQGDEHPDEIQRAKSYIRLHYREPITVSGLAEMLSLSRSHFSKAFHRKTGQTVQDYLIQCRLTAAKQLLRESDLSMEEIALFCGFRTAPAFSKTFRAHEGLSPAHYRKK